MHQFVLGQHEYRSNNIDVFKQNLIVKRITPFATAFVECIGSIRKDPVSALAPLTKALSEMPDDDAEYIITRCLEVTSRKQGEGWIAVYIPGGGMNCQDIGLLEMYEIVYHVLKDNLSSFFSELVQRGFVPISVLQSN